MLIFDFEKFLIVDLEKEEEEENSLIVDLEKEEKSLIVDSEKN